MDKPSMESSALLNFRIINYFVAIFTAGAVGWMSTGKYLLRPVCNIEFFESRKASCLRNGTLEMRDRLSIALLIAEVLLFLILITKTRYRDLIQTDTPVNRSIDLIAISSVFAAIVSKNYYNSFDDWSLNEFSGFSFEVAFVTLMLTAMVVMILRIPELWQLSRNVFSKNLNRMNFCLSIIFFVFYFPALVQLSTGLSSIGDSIYVYNDLAGATAGNFPLADFMPHYNSLLGWPIFAISKIFGAGSVFITVPIWITMLNFSVILLLNIILIRVFPKIPTMFGLVGICSLLITRSGDTRFSFTSQSFPSWVSRLVLPTCGALLLHFLFCRLNQSKNNILFIILGFISSLIAINNLEFGLTAFLSMSLVILLFAVFKLIRPFDLILYISGLLTGLFIIVGAFNLSGRTIKPDFYFMISQEFAAKGFGSWPMPIFGLYVLAYSVIGITLIFSFRVLLAITRTDRALIDADCLGNLALCLFGGLWSVQSLTYYSSRSVDGSLRVIFVPILLATIPLLKLTNLFAKDPIGRKRQILPILPMLAICLIPAALLIKAPEPQANWSRILNSESSWSWETTKNRPISKEVLRFSAEERRRIGIMAFDGNAVELVTDARNLLSTPNFQILGLSERIRSLGCARLLESKVQIVFIEGNYANGSEAPCPGLTNPKLLSDGAVTVFDLSKP